jgi:hypothetical protein
MCELNTPVTATVMTLLEPVDLACFDLIASVWGASTAGLAL